MITLGVSAMPASAALPPIPGLPSLGLLPSPPAPTDFFGLGAEHGNVSASKRASDLDAQKATGITTMREQIRWSQIERSPGNYDFSTLDGIMRDMAARGIRMLPDLVYAPDFYTNRPATGAGSNQYPPRDPATLATFATKLVKRYGPRGSFWCKTLPVSSALGRTIKDCSKTVLPVTTWQVWNEPDYPAWWGAKPDAAAYANLLTTVSAAIHKADKHAQVMLGGLTNKAAGSGYLGQLYAAGAAPSFDVMALHPYGATVSTVLAEIRQVRTLMVNNGDGSKPMSLTEYGWADGGSRSAFIVKSKCQAALVYTATRRLSDLRTELGLQSIYEFYWNDQPAAKSASWPFFAGMVKTNGAAKPTLAAFTAAVKNQPPPAGLTLAAACPASRQSTS